MAEVSRVLRLAIDAKGAKRGAREYSSELDRVKRQSRDAASETDRVDRSLRDLADGMVIASAAAGLIGAATLEATRRLVLLGSEVEETANKFDVVFGASAESARREMQAMAEVVPLTTREMEAMASGIQDMLVPMGVARSEAAGLSVEAIRLAADIGSLNNVATADVLMAFQSALAGQSEPMRRFGVDTRQAALQAIALEEGLVRAGQEMDNAARAQAVLLAIQEDSTDAMGDAERTADSTANTIKRMNRNVRETAEQFGVMFSEGAQVSRMLRDMESASRLLLDALKANEDEIRTGVVGAFDLATIAVLGLRDSVNLVIGLIDSLPGGGLLVDGVLGNLEEIRDVRTAMQEAERIASEIALGTRDMPAGLTGDFDSDVERLVELAGERADAVERRAEGERIYQQALAEAEAAEQAALDRQREAAAAVKAQAEALSDAISQSDSLTAAYELGLTTTQETLGEYEELRDLLSGIADDEERAREQRVDAATELLEIEGEILRIRLEQLGVGSGTLPRRTVSTRPSGGEIMVPEVERLIEDTGRLAEVLRGAGAETDNWAESIDPAVRGIIAVADGFGLIEGRARDAVRGLSDIAGGISSLQGAAGQAGGFGQALSTAGGIASLLPGAGQIIGGVAGLLGGLFGGGPSAEELEQMRLAEERNRILEQNLNAVERLRSDLGPPMEQLVTKFATAFEASGRGLDTLRPDQVADEILAIIRGNLTTFDDPVSGLDSGDIGALADQLDIDILDPEGGFNTDALEQLAEAIGFVMEQVQRAQDAFNEELGVRRLLAQGMDEEAAARRRMLEDQAEIQRALEQGFDETTIAALREVQALEEEARAKREATRAAEEAARQERERASTLSDFDAREAALEGEDIEALRIRREAAAEQELAALEKLAAEGRFTADEMERFARILDGEVDAAVQDAINAANERARAEREAAEAERFRAMVDMENLRVRNLVARGMDREAEALRAQLEIMNAVNDGRSEEYIALLRQTLAIEQQNQAERDRQRAIEETTRQIDGMTRVLNGPAGFSVALRQAQTLGVGSPVFGVQTPNFQAPLSGGSGDINIQSVTIQAAPGDSGADLWAKFQEEARRQARATGSNPFDGIGEG